MPTTTLLLCCHFVMRLVLGACWILQLRTVLSRSPLPTTTTHSSYLRLRTLYLPTLPAVTYLAVPHWTRLFLRAVPPLFACLLLLGYLCRFKTPAFQLPPGFRHALVLYLGSAVLTTERFASSYLYCRCTFVLLFTTTTCRFTYTCPVPDSTVPVAVERPCRDNALPRLIAY